MRAPAKNLTNQQFGLLIVRRRAESPEGQKPRKFWWCRCSCGVEKPIREDALLSGRAKSCGCATQRFKKSKLEKRYSLLNQRFGRLFVLWRSASSKGRNIVWDCKCDCGKIVPVTGSALRSGTQSCGCLLKESWLPQGRAVRNIVLKRYRRDAEREGRTWELSEERFDELVKGNCHYCGTEPIHSTRAPNCNGEFVCNGIDRLNSKLGYVVGNVVSCCYPCNLMKRVLSPDAFIAHIRKILNHWDNKNSLKVGLNG